MSFDKVDEIHLQSLMGLGSSYQMKGYFILKSKNKSIKINFKGIAFGGHYGGHNVSIQVSAQARKNIVATGQFKDDADIDNLLSEVQRRILNGDMIVEFKNI